MVLAPVYGRVWSRRKMDNIDREDAPSRRNKGDFTNGGRESGQELLGKL